MSGEILRGMHVEVQPLRVGRLPVPPPEPDLSPPSPAEEARREREEAALRQARMDAERAGHEEGLRKGRAEAAAQSQAAVAQAIAKAQAELQVQRQQFALLRGSMVQAAEDALRVAEDDMVALCFETICRIVGERALEPDAVRAQVRALIARLEHPSSAVLHLHPKDVELLQQDGGMRVVPDADVALGGCIVQHAHGGIEARLETLLANCKEALLATRRRRAAPEGRS